MLHSALLLPFERSVCMYTDSYVLFVNCAQENQPAMTLVPKENLLHCLSPSINSTILLHSPPQNFDSKTAPNKRKQTAKAVLITEAQQFNLQRQAML